MKKCPDDCRREAQQAREFFIHPESDIMEELRRLNVRLQDVTIIQKKDGKVLKP